jgi:hypothetical protein
MNARSCTLAGGFVAALFCSTGTLADSQYNADRAYCNSSGNQQGRALCLKEAMAAQNDRRRGGNEHRSDMKQDTSQQDESSGASGNGLKERAHEDAQKTRGFTHRQLQKARSFGARHAPSDSTNETDKAPAALGK